MIALYGLVVLYVALAAGMTEVLPDVDYKAISEQQHKVDQQKAEKKETEK